MELVCNLGYTGQTANSHLLIADSIKNSGFMGSAFKKSLLHQHLSTIYSFLSLEEAESLIDQYRDVLHNETQYGLLKEKNTVLAGQREDLDLLGLQDRNFTLEGLLYEKRGSFICTWTCGPPGASPVSGRFLSPPFTFICYAINIENYIPIQFS